MGTRADLRAIYLALWETGARVAEITGLQVRDVNLQDRSLRIQSNGIRGLKTLSSERLLPISDQSVAALQDLRQGKMEEVPIFDRYGRVGGNTAASALMMKHLRKIISDPKKALHSLRHKKKDDLRNIGCPEEVSKVLLGHSSVEVAARYGAGFNLDVLRDWMTRSSQVGGLTQ
jgi:integrase